MFSGYLWNGIVALSLGTFLDQGYHPCLSLDCLYSDKNTSLTAALAAFWHISVRSAPEKPSVMLAMKLMSTSLEIGVFLRLAFRMPRREG